MEEEVLELYGSALICDDESILRLCKAIFSEDDECMKKDECCKECKCMEHEG